MLHHFSLHTAQINQLFVYSVFVCTLALFFKTLLAFLCVVKCFIAT